MSVSSTEELDRELVAMRAARLGASAISQRLGLSIDEVHERARALGAPMTRRQGWADAEVAELREMEANDLQVRAIARALGRSEQSVTWKLKDLDIPRRRLRRWADDDARLLAMTDAGAGAPEVAAAIGRAETAVRARLAVLRPTRAKRTWTVLEVDALRAEAAAMTPGDLAARLGREVGSVTSKVYALGLRFAHPERRLDESQALELSRALARKGGLLDYARTLGVDARWLRDRARELGHGIQRRRRRPLDEEGRAEIVAAARSGMPVTEAIRALGRDIRTLRTVAEEAGVPFAGRPVAKPKRVPQKVRSMAHSPVRGTRRDAPAVAAPFRAAPVARMTVPRLADLPRPAAPAVERAGPVDAGADAIRVASAGPVRVVLGDASREGRLGAGMDAAVVSDAVAAFLARREVTREVLDPVEATVRAMRRRGYTVVRDGGSFVIDGRTRVDGDDALVSFATDRSILATVGHGATTV